MTFKIINNLSDQKNHSVRLKELFEISESVLVVSPYLMSDAGDFLSGINLTKIKNIHLVTILKPGDHDQIRKMDFLSSLINYPEIKSGNVVCRVSINNKLHGKIYVFEKESGFIAAVISSANFTKKGLAINHEWGIEIENQAEIQFLTDSIIGSIERELNFEEIRLLQKAADDFSDKHPEKEEKKISLDLLGGLPANDWFERIADATDFWLKPIGVSEDPVKDTDDFSADGAPLHFTVKKPTGVKPFDILITYGVGQGKILSLYQCVSLPQRNEASKRWPWYVTGRNLTPRFGRTWLKHSLHINALREEFLKRNPNLPVTKAGGSTLGAFNRGQDKIKLSRDFARFLIGKMLAVDPGREPSFRKQTSAEPAMIDVPAMLIRIRKTYREGMSAGELFEVTRGIWHVGPKRERPKYAFAVVAGIIKEVYRIDRWLPAGTLEYKHRKDAGNFKNRPGRWEFDGGLAEENLRNRLVGKSCAHCFKKGHISPTVYVNC